MAITFTVNDIVLDEQAGEHTLDDNDITFAAFNTAVGATVANYLGGLPHASGGDQTVFAQAAERTDFLALSSTVPVTDLSFAINGDGDPFPTEAGEGINSGLTDIDGNTIWLFQGIDDVVIGVIGNDPTASVAFAIVLNETLTNGLVTGASLWVVQYEALFEDGINLVDSADILDLTDKLFVAASSQITLNFSDFRDVASGQTEFAMIAPDTAPPGQEGAIQILATGIAPNGSHSTVNVSTQGGFNGSLGVGNQGIAVGEALRIDVVTGGDVVYSSKESHNAANIDFSDHREVNQASFGIVQTNPNNGSVDALLTAYNVTATEDTVDGAAFVALAHDGTADPKATITSVTVKDQNGNVIELVSNDGNPANDITGSAVIITFQADKSVLINNLKDDYLVDFTTSDDPAGGAGMDRFVVQNVGTGNEQFDIERLSVSSTSITLESQEIGSHVIFEDDGPTVAANNLVQLDDDALTGGNPDGPGDDPNAVNTSGTLAHNFGADGAGSIALLDTGTLPSGFTAALSGVGNTILTISQGGTAVLRVTVTDTTSGAYTVEQLAAIDHAGTTPGFEDNLAFSVAYRVTDGEDADGDTADGTLSIDVDDDTPTTASNLLVQLDDDALTGGNPDGPGDDPNAVNTSGTLAHSYGADGAGSIALLDTGTLPSGFTAALSGVGTILTISQGGTAVLRVTVTDTTSGAYTVEQLAAIDHAGTTPGFEDNLAFSVAYRATDGDGDTADGTLSIDVDDDTPTTASNLLVQLDDDALTGGNPDGPGDDPNAVNTSGTLAHSYGADGAGSIALLDTGTLPSGFTAALSGVGTILTISQGGTAVLRVTVTDTTSGAYTVEQLAAIDHAGTTPGFEDNLAFSVAYRATDGDGDTADGTLSIDVDDDTPTTASNLLVQLDDDALTGGNPDGPGDDPNAVNTSGTLAHSYGADGAGSIALLDTGTLPSGFTAALSGVGTILTISQGGTAVLRVTVTDTTSGAYTVEQLAAIDHAGTTPGFEDNLAFSVAYRATDGDGDTADGTLSIDVDDDTPTVTVNDATGTYVLGAQGTWTDLPGADGFGSLGVTFNSYQIDSHGSGTGDVTFTKTGDFAFEGSITDDFNGDGTDDIVGFTLTFNPGLDSYDLQVTTPPETVVDFSTADGSVPAGGPDPVQTITVGDIDIVFSAVEPDTPFAEIAANVGQTEAFIEANADYLTLMNVSTTGIGVGDNNLDGNASSGIDGEDTGGGNGVDESFVVDPEGDVSSVKVLIAANGGPSYNPATEELFYLKYDADGNPVGTPTLVTADDLTTEADGKLSFVIGDPEGPNNIEAVQLFMGTGTVKIPEIQFTVSTTFQAEPVQLDFTATLADGDGDTQTDTFSVDLNV